MHTIAVINQKGGVGKSTTAHALGMGLSDRGHRVLLVDLDPQGNMSYTLNVDESDESTMDFLLGKISPGAALDKRCDVYAVPSTPDLAAADTVLTAVGKEYKLKEALSPLTERFDYCVIDTPPSLGILTVNALTAANEALIPAQADIYSMQGIQALSGTIDAIRRYCNPTLSILGILLTRYNGRTIISRDVADMLEETAKTLGTRLFKTRIRECTAIRESQLVKHSIFDYAAKSNAAADYNALIDEIFGAETARKEKKKWLKRASK